MHWGSPLFVLAIIAMSVGALVVTTWIRARHGYPLTDDCGRPVEKGDRLGSERQIELLSSENAGLKSQVGRLEERIAVLERIATDPAERTAREIDSLR